jgi:RNA polymerase sigma factor (sigma-70 family)
MIIITFGDSKNITPMSDRELLDGIALKDETAFNSLYEKYAQKLARFALKFTKDEYLSQEIVQLFWIRVWQHPEEIKTDTEGDAYRYLSKFFTFRILDKLREKAAVQETYSGFMDSEEGFDGQMYDISDDMERKELYDAIAVALDNLSDTYRHIFRLLYVDELQVKEAAKVLGMDERTVLYKSKHCVENMRSSIKDWYSSKGDANLPEIDLNDLRQNISILLIASAYYYF